MSLGGLIRQGGFKSFKGHSHEKVFEIIPHIAMIFLKRDP
jgi:hypothetical protein